MDACGAAEQQTVSTVDYFTSHEGLVLAYESAVTDEYDGKYYNTGAHFLWIGVLCAMCYVLYAACFGDYVLWRIRCNVR